MRTIKNFPPYEEAKRIVIEKGFKSESEYYTKHKGLGLPSNPNKFYKDKGWIDWAAFLGKESHSYEDAKRIVMENGIKSVDEYKAKYKELGLPSAPNITYKDKGWIDWPSFWGKEKIKYPSYEDTKRIMMKNRIKSREEYKAKYKELGLPPYPNKTYKKEWIDWPSFWGKEKESHSYEDAKRIVMENGIKNRREYNAKYNELGLPSTPKEYYKKEWIDWFTFLGKEKIEYPTYEDAKRIVMEKGIKNRREYNAKYNKLRLPSEPYNTYKEEWIDWADFLGRPYKTTPMERKTKVLSKMALNPILLGDKAPLQIIYILASNIDKELAKEIEILLKTTSFEERLDWVKEQLKTLKVDTPTTPKSTRETLDSEIPAMESMLEIFEDSMDELPEDVTTNIQTILENYYHNVMNKELIEEYDG